MPASAADLLPAYDVADTLTRTAATPPPQVFAALQRWRPGRHGRDRALFALRDVPARLCGRGHEGMAALTARPPLPLHVEPPSIHAVGMVCRPWHPLLALRVLDAAAFAAFATPGFCRILWHFSVTPAATGSVLQLRTRVQALGGAGARRRLALYWRLSARLSARVRGDWLAAILAAAAP